MILKLVTLSLSLLAFMSLVAGCSGGSATLDLLTAIDRERRDIVQQHMDSGTDPNKDPAPVGTSLEGAYPLHLAVIKGNKEIVQILLDNGAKIDLKAKNKDEATPLHWAAFFGQKDIVSLLIGSGAPINALDANEFTPLGSAFFAWHISQDDEGKGRLREIMTILETNGGKHAKDL